MVSACCQVMDDSPAPALAVRTLQGSAPDEDLNTVQMRVVRGAHQRRPSVSVELVGVGATRQQHAHHEVLPVAAGAVQRRVPSCISAVDGGARLEEEVDALGVAFEGG